MLRKFFGGFSLSEMAAVLFVFAVLASIAIAERQVYNACHSAFNVELCVSEFRSARGF